MKLITVPTLMMATLLYAIGMPVSAQASDWEEYEIVCEAQSKPKLDSAADRYVVKRTELASVVNKMITDGWQPLGGVSVWKYGSSTILCQAMVKD
ncbi:MAG: hypothetical protein OXI10_06895 [Gammaproteobacteria bacterium]|nr:hypothetical protein [Gammaproteobacteria bacterium]